MSNCATLSTDSLVSNMKYTVLASFGNRVQSSWYLIPCHSLIHWTEQLREWSHYLILPVLLHLSPLLCAQGKESEGKPAPPRPLIPPRPPKPWTPPSKHTSWHLDKTHMNWQTKRKGRKRGRGSSGVWVLKRIEEACALKHFPSATDLSAAHVCCAWVGLSVFLFVLPELLSGRLDADHGWKGQLSGTIGFLILGLYISYAFHLSNETQLLPYEVREMNSPSLFVGGLCLCKAWLHRY